MDSIKTAGVRSARGAPTHRAPPFLLLWLTLAVWMVLVVLLGGATLGGSIADRLGDTDDAMRLTLVRDLVAGRAGWYDQHFTRLQPPLGMDLHWSRLVDGGLAGLELLFRLFLAPAAAEYAARVAWPLLWIAPAVAATLAVARSLRGDSAAFACAALLSVTQLLFFQWAPGRIDHHNLQITAALCAVAGAIAGDRRGGWLAGAATAFGLAIGLESLALLAMAGAVVALTFIFNPAAYARAARGYALALLGGLIALYLLQTPPAWWAVSRCDALGVNLVLGAGVAAFGLLAIAQFAARAGLGVRLAALAGVGAAAVAACLALAPGCLQGPFSQIDPRVAPIFLDQVSELQPLAHYLRGFAPEAVCALAMLVLGAASWLWLGRRPEGRTRAWWIAGAGLLVAGAGAVQALRLICYSSLLAAPIVAAAAADVALRLRRGQLAGAVGLAIALSPTWASAAAVSRIADKHQVPPSLGCPAASAYRRLAALPSGLVLGEVGLGAFVLATTPHAVLAAPYHRADWGIVAADAALAAAPGADEAAVRRLRVAYVIDCPAQANYPRRQQIGPHSLQVRLDRREVPAWLQPLSAPAEPLQVYRVRPQPRS